LGTTLGLGLLGLSTGQIHVPTNGTAWALIGVIVLFPTVLALLATLFASKRLGADRASLIGVVVLSDTNSP